MPSEDKVLERGTIATVVATAAVTLAIGVTAAALGGVLTPARDRDTTTAADSTGPIVSPLPAPHANAPTVVLVPVAPDGRPEPSTVSAPQQPEMLVAAYDAVAHPDDDDDHHRNREHHARTHEDDRDDDD